MYIALWCKNQIGHSIWDESSLLCICACSLENSSLSTLAGRSYHNCGKIEVAIKASPSSHYQYCTDEAQKAETVLSAVMYMYLYFSPSLFHLVWRYVQGKTVPEVLITKETGEQLSIRTVIMTKFLNIRPRTS